MLRLHDLAILLAPLALVLACSDVPASEDEAGVTTSPGSEGSDVVDGVDETTSSDDAATSTGMTSTDTIGDESTSASFVPVTDAYLDSCMCDTFAQDCPQGEKCVPFSIGGDTWDCVKCVPVLGEQAVGDPCMSAGVVEATDDCDGTSLCWDVDENGNGICHAFCTGSPDAPECPPMSWCTISDSGVINVCISNCDPVIQDCPEGSACYYDGTSFGCYASSENLPVGDPCSFANDCGLGSVCVEAAVLPECVGPSCCTNFCELGLGDAQCDALPGTACVPFFEMGQAPAGYEHVGLCILPP